MEFFFKHSLLYCTRASRCLRNINIRHLLISESQPLIFFRGLPAALTITYFFSRPAGRNHHHLFFSHLEVLAKIRKNTTTYFFFARITKHFLSEYPEITTTYYFSGFFATCRLRSPPLIFFRGLPATNTTTYFYSAASAPRNKYEWP